MFSTPDARLTVPAHADYLAVCRSALAGALSATDAADDEIDDLKLVLSEVCADAIGHHADGMLEVEFRTSADAVEIAVSGPGSQAGPRNAPPIADPVARAVIDGMSGCCSVAALDGRPGVSITYPRLPR